VGVPDDSFAIEGGTDTNTESKFAVFLTCMYYEIMNFLTTLQSQPGVSLNGGVSLTRCTFSGWAVPIDCAAPHIAILVC
jgi:hypothetical protein